MRLFLLILSTKPEVFKVSLHFLTGLNRAIYDNLAVSGNERFIMKKSILFVVMLMLGLISGASASTINYTASPVNKQLYPRDINNNLAPVTVSGTVEGTGPSSIMVRIWRDGVVYSETSQTLVFSGSSAPFSVAPTIEAVLKNYTVDVILVQGGETLDRQVTEVVAGDAYIINGQSNASCQIDNGYASAAPDERAFIRTFGANWDEAVAEALDQNWRLARGDDSLWKTDGSIGRWGLRVGRLLTEETHVPVAILNAGRGAWNISLFQRNDADHTDLNTNYGRIFARTIWAGINNHVRAVLWYQGESDNGNKAVHEAGFMALYNDWKENYPRLERVYVHQLHVGCGVIKNQLELRDWQRRLPDTYSDIKVMSTNGNDEHDGCHYTDLGHQKGGNNLAALVAAELYGSANTANTTAPNPQFVYFSTPTFDEITIVMRNPTDTLSFNAGATSDFILLGSTVTVTSGSISGNTVVLSLTGDASLAIGLGYTGHSGTDAGYGPGEWVLNAAGVGLLSFSEEILLSSEAVALGDLLQIYDGSAKPVSVSTAPAGLAVDVTYDGSPTAPIDPGSYTVIGTINDLTYQGAATNTLVIQMPADYDTWANTWFTPAEQADPAISGPEIYHDADDYSNWEEYIVGTNPTDTQSVPIFQMQATALNGYILSWSSVSGRVYSINWSSDLMQGLLPLKENILWPQSSYTDLTHQAETEGFYQMSAAFPIAITTATVTAESSLGVAGDLFHGATVTASSPMHSAGVFPASNMFNTEVGPFLDAIFADASGNSLSFVEFHTSSEVKLRNIVVGLANDEMSGADDPRSISHIKVYAAAVPGAVPDNLIADIAIDPEYTTAYGSNQITVSIDLAVNAQYFRAEFTELNDATGGRIMEIDGFLE